MMPQPATSSASSLHGSPTTISLTSPLSFHPTWRCVRVTVVLVVLGVVLLSSPGVEGQGTREDYRRLYSFLFDNYSVDIRPVNDYTSNTDVYLALVLFSIVDVNEKEQTLKTSTLLSIEWDDEHLSWNPADYNNITTFLLRQRHLWLPDIVVGNTVTTQTHLGYKNLKTRITYEGRVIWAPSIVLETACDIDITYYPFDTQVCSLTFKTAMSTNTEVYVYIDKVTPVDMTHFSGNSLWEIKNTSATTIATLDQDSKNMIIFKLQLQRRRSYYILNILLPILFLSVTSCLTFALPCEAGEKTGLSITVLLAFAVYLTLVTDAMPTTSVKVSVVTIYLVVLLALTAASVVLSVFIIRIHYRHHSAPVTGCLAAIIPTLRALLFLNPIPPPEDSSEEEERRKDDIMLESISDQSHSASDIKLMPQMPRAAATRRSALNAVSPGRGGSSNETSTMSLTSNVKAKGVGGPLVAETLDKFIFVLFSFINVMSTFVCFIVLLDGAGKQFVKTKLS